MSAINPYLIFTSKKNTALRKYQKDKGLKVDGIAGTATASKLKE